MSQTYTDGMTGRVAPPDDPTPDEGVAASVDAALDRAIAFLRRTQRDENHWVGTLSSSALATAISIVALHVFDASTHHERIAQGRRWLVQTQHEDGGWGDAVVDPSNINATSLVIGALTLTAPSHTDRTVDAALQRARPALEQFGGWEAVGDPARCTLSGPCRTVAAMAGILDWRRIKRLRPEVLLLPTRLRRTISTTFPAYLSISTLHAAMAPHPLNYAPTYHRAREEAREWLQRAQGPNGSFEESAFLTSVIVACWVVQGQRALPWLRDAVRFVIESQRDDGGWPIDRDLETFDTDMSVFAFHAAGLPTPNEANVRAWLLARQFDEVCFPTGAQPGGWAWAMPAGWPDADDTAYTILALRTLGVPPSARPVRRGARWLEWLQSSDGSWPTFVRNSRMPFDHDCPYITGHALSALHAAGRLGPASPVLRRALGYLARSQRYDGSFASIWFRETTAGTGSVLEALADCGLVQTPMALQACDALLRSQNDDGGWAGLRRQQSTAEETSWAVMALARCPGDDQVRAAIARGARWLVGHQRFDGTWSPTPIGLYYSAMWYSDSSFAVTLPVQALARARGQDATT